MEKETLVSLSPEDAIAVKPWVKVCVGSVNSGSNYSPGGFPQSCSAPGKLMQLLLKILMV